MLACREPASTPKKQAAISKVTCGAKHAKQTSNEQGCMQGCPEA